jgi:large subunit ribosomal protein L23
VSNESDKGTPANSGESKQETVSKPKSTMSSEQAASLIMAPYVTEKTFNQIEKENKLAFIVAEKATKKQIINAILILYEADIAEVNTTRTIRGKKAFVKFKAPDGARDLATKLALV